MFSDLLPQNAKAIVSIPRVGETWTAFRSTYLFQGMQDLARTLGLSENGQSGQGEAFFEEALSSAELVLLPSDPLTGSRGFLLLAKTEDVLSLRRLLEILEKQALERTTSAGRTVRRIEESIGSASLTFLSDADSTFGYLLSGPRSLFAFSNRPHALRQVARDLASGCGGEAEGKGASDALRFPGMVKARESLARTSKMDKGFQIRFCFAPPETNEGARSEADGHGAALDPLLRSLQPRGWVAGGIRMERDRIQAEVFALFPSEGQSLIAELYQAEPAESRLAGLTLSAPDALVVSGNNLLDVPVLKKFLVKLVDATSGALPEASPSGLNPASARTQSHLAMVRGWLSDPDFLRELGPRWFFALNRAEFREPGTLPAVDFCMGFQTDEPELTESRLRALEEDLVEAVREWSRDKTLGETSTPTDSPVIEEIVAEGRESAIRYLSLPRLPADFQPAWTVARGWLFFALSPREIEETLLRMTATSVDADLAQTRAETGMDRVHAYQVIRFEALSEPLRALAEAWAGRMGPEFLGRVEILWKMLAPLDRIVILRRGDEMGVHTLGILSLREKERAPEQHTPPAVP
ncbi:hypothetical protein HQ520_07855 [bacterium]|nr:hypothetical protein [bacterium]